MKKMSKVKKVIISVICIIAAAGACCGAAFAICGKNADTGDGESNYREYTAVKDDITVGISESGTASVKRSYLSFPVSAEVEEVYVKVGSEVKNGDKIAKLSTEDTDEIKKQYETKLSAARLELESAVTESRTKLAQAKDTYESNLLESSSAQETYNLSVTKIQSDISAAKKNIETLKKELSEYEALEETYSDDNKKYTEYDKTYSEYEDTYESLKNTYEGYEKTLKEYEKELEDVTGDYNDYVESVEDEYNELVKMQENIQQTQEAMTEAKKALEKAQSRQVFSNSEIYSTETGTQQGDNQNSSGTASQNSNNTLKSAQEKYDDAVDAYNEAYNAYESSAKSKYATILQRKEIRENKVKAAENKVNEYKEMMEEYSEKIDEYSKEMSKYKTEFDDYNSDYTELYGNMDSEDISERISDLKSQIESAEYELKKLETNVDGSMLSAEQTLNGSVLGASTAAEIYNQTVEQINSGIEEKRENCNNLEKEYNTLLEDMGDGIFIYADCSGYVSSLNISAGDTIMENQTVASLMDTSEVYVSVSVSEDDISTLTVGQASSVSLSAYEGMNVDGEIDTIAVEPSRSSGAVSYAVSVKIYPSENVKIYEGMTCDVTFLQKRVSDVVYVNVQAVKYKSGGVSSVLVYGADGEVSAKEVITGFSDGRYVEIISGLSAGDKVLAESAVKSK